MTKRTTTIAAVSFTFAIGLLVTYALGGVRLIPVSVALGPCWKDWTSPTTYRPRVSPMETVDFDVGGSPVRVCYSRPSARGRQVAGNLIPFGRVWRTGANEPTRIFTARPIVVAGVTLAPGRYSLYSEPDSSEWRVFFSRSTFHWGNSIHRGVRAEEVGQGTVPVDSSDSFVESLTIRPSPNAEDATEIVVEWGWVRVGMPVGRAGGR